MKENGLLMFQDNLIIKRDKTSCDLTKQLTNKNTHSCFQLLLPVVCHQLIIFNQKKTNTTPINQLSILAKCKNQKNVSIKKYY